MKYNLLVVTDHSTHSSTNSLYELSLALHGDRRSKHVWVCSNGLEENADFFNAKSGSSIHAALVNNKFSYQDGDAYLKTKSVRIDPDEIDVVLIRMPQPLDKDFLRSLEQFASLRKIINNPAGTIETSSKEFLLRFAHLCPSPKMVNNIQEAIELSREREIVLKPLYSYGGRGIMRLSPRYFWQGMTCYPAEEISSLITDQVFPMLAMDYLANVSFGDKRTIVVNKQILGSALRMPPENSWICNVAQGGHALISEADENELMFEQELTPILFEKGVIMYGFDTLVNDEGKRVLSEINTLSIGGLVPMEEMSGKPMLKQAARLLWDYVERNT